MRTVSLQANEKARKHPKDIRIIDRNHGVVSKIIPDSRPAHKSKKGHRPDFPPLKSSAQYRRRRKQTAEKLNDIGLTAGAAFEASGNGVTTASGESFPKEHVSDFVVLILLSLIRP